MLFVTLAAVSMSVLSAQRPASLDGSAFPYDGVILDGGSGMHDPAICEFQGHYFVLTTSANGFCALHSSPDLVHWKSEGNLLAEPPVWLQRANPQHRSIWAPEAHRVGDGMRVYYCASAAFGHNNSWIGYAECPHFDPNHPTVGWQDRGMLIESKDGRDNFNAIDPSILIDATGRNWMVFGSYWSGIYEVEIDPVSGGLLHSDRSDMKLVARNPRDRANGIEAPCAIYRDGYYYLIVNYGLAAQGVRSTYQLMVGRSKSPTGPFVDSRGVDMVEGGHETLLDSSAPMFAPGGGSAIRDTDGRWLLSYHYYDGRRSWRGHLWGLPTLQVRELLWSADGWPLPGLPVIPAVDDLARHTHADVCGHWLHQADFGNVDEIELRRDGKIVRNRVVEGAWKEDGERLELNWQTGDGNYTDTLTLAYGNNYYVGRNGTGLVIRGIRKGG